MGFLERKEYILYLLCTKECFVLMQGLTELPKLNRDYTIMYSTRTLESLIGNIHRLLDIAAVPGSLLSDALLVKGIKSLLFVSPKLLKPLFQTYDCRWHRLGALICSDFYFIIINIEIYKTRHGLRLRMNNE